MRETSAKLYFLKNVSLQWKFYCVITTLLIMMAVSFTLLIEQKMFNFYNKEVNKDGIAIGRMVAANSVKPILTNDLVGLRTLLTGFLNAERGLEYLYILTPDNKVIAHSFDGGFPTDLIGISAFPPQKNKIRERELNTDKGMIHEIVVPIIEGEAGFVHAGMSKEHVFESISDTKSDLIKVTGLLCLFGLVSAYIFNRLVTSPLSTLASATDKIAKGSLEIKLPERGDDEIGALTASFNKMTQELRTNNDERKRIEKSLRNSEELYRSLIENIELGITLMDTDHNIIMVNSGQASMFNRSRESFIGKKCYREFEKNEKICEHCPGVVAMRTGSSKEQEAQGVLDNGESFIVKIRAFPVSDSSGSPLGFIEVVENITDQRRTEEELRKIKNIESIGLLAGGLAHDFNNLLAAILGNIELAMVKLPPEDPVSTRLNAAEAACNQAKHLTEQLLTFAKGGAPRKATVFLPHLLEDSCSFTLSGSDIKWILVAPDETWPGNLDRTQMGQVIHHLLTNAQEASKPGGKIFVIAENVTVDDSFDLPITEGKYIKIVVEDEGEGINPEILPRIFDPYFTTKEIGSEKGTGLGLTICHSIVKKHGGHIDVESKVGAGTAVTLYIPKAELDILKSPDETGERNTIQDNEESRKILLMEDDRKLAKTTANMLVHLRHKFEVASDGDNAIRIYKESLNTDDPYDLLILDLTIRGGIGGQETIQKISEINPDAKAIVCSGYSDDPVMVNYRDYGFTASLPKPFRITDLQNAIRKAVR